MKQIKLGNISANLVEDFPTRNVEFIDLSPTIINNDIQEIIKEIRNQFDPNEFDYIVAPDARGFIWGSFLSALSNIPLIPIRKTGKLPIECTQFTEQYTTEYSDTMLSLPLADLKGKRILFIDDVLATGGTYFATKHLIEHCGGSIAFSVFIVDIGLRNSHNVFICDLIDNCYIYSTKSKLKALGDVKLV